MNRARLLFAIVLILGSSALGTAQLENKSWRQKILLLNSTRQDVEKLFGKPSLGHDYLVSYKLSDGTLDVEYYPFDHCKPGDGLTAYLNVPKWTVTEIDFRPDSQPTVTSLHLDLKPLRKAHTNPDLPDFVSYFEDQEGIEYTIDEHTHRLNSVRYFPGSRYDALRCQKD